MAELKLKNQEARKDFLALQKYYGFSCKFTSDITGIHNTALSKWLHDERDLTQGNLQKLTSFLSRYPKL